jgi:hypothetical protein
MKAKLILIRALFVMLFACYLNMFPLFGLFHTFRKVFHYDGTIFIKIRSGHKACTVVVTFDAITLKNERNHEK